MANAIKQNGRCAAPVSGILHNSSIKSGHFNALVLFRDLLKMSVLCICGLWSKMSKTEESHRPANSACIHTKGIRMEIWS